MSRTTRRGFDRIVTGTYKETVLTMSSKALSVVLSVLVAGLAIGCAKPPTPAIEGASAALEAAAEAEMYAADAYKAAAEARQQLDAELTAQEEKVALFRSYTKASELAASATMAAEQAKADAIAEKERVRAETTQLIADAKLAVEEAKQLLETAPRGKGSQADLETMKSDLTSVELSLGEADTALAASNFKEARNKAEAAMQAAMQVKTAVEQAQRARAGARPRG